MANSKFSEEKIKSILEQFKEKSKLYEYRTKDYPFEVIYRKFGDENDPEKSLYVPNYQRKFVWRKDRQSKFIESVYLGVPLTPFLVSEDKQLRLEIIDGSQRIRTLIDFFDNKLQLNCLEKLTEFNNIKFNDLPLKLQNYFKNRDFRIIVVEDASIEVRQDIYARINTTSEKLTDAEIRRGSYSGKFYDLVLSLIKDEKFRNICPVTKQKEDRGEYEELVLRFLAYSDSYIDFKHDVASFLNDYLNTMNESEFDENEYKNRFNKMCAFIEKHYPNGFRREKNSNTTPRVRFEAISVGTYLALNENPDIENPNLNWLDSEGFSIQTTSDASNNPNRLKNRVEFVRDGLLGRLTENRLQNG